MSTAVRVAAGDAGVESLWELEVLQSWLKTFKVDKSLFCVVK